MRSTVRRVRGRGRGRVAAAILGLMAPWLAAGRAEAQWGWGWGGFYNPENASRVVGQIDQRFNIQAAAAAKFANAPGFNYNSTSNSYLNHLHDGQYFDRYDTASRRRTEDRVARAPTAVAAPTPRPATSRPAAAAAGPVLPITSFFNRYDELVWPADAPVAGDMAQKRATSDKASLAVMQEVKKDGYATVGVVTDARSKLLDYGRPALQFLRANTTSRISDSFHLFLLSLYDSLAQAATPSGDGG